MKAACLERATVSAILAAERAGLPPERLIFEFSEKEELEAPQIMQIMSAYREIGFKTAIDDFGSGHSGLALLTKMQPDIVKIDIELIRDIDSEPVKRVILSHVVELLDDLGVISVCEGVETPAELAVIRDLGADLVQGYLISTPAFKSLVEPDVSALIGPSVPLSEARGLPGAGIPTVGSAQDHGTYGPFESA